MQIYNLIGQQTKSEQLKSILFSACMSIHTRLRRRFRKKSMHTLRSQYIDADFGSVLYILYDR